MTIRELIKKLEEQPNLDATIVCRNRDRSEPATLLMVASVVTDTESPVGLILAPFLVMQ